MSVRTCWLKAAAAVQTTLIGLEKRYHIISLRRNDCAKPLSFFNWEKSSHRSYKIISDAYYSLNVRLLSCFISSEAAVYQDTLSKRDAKQSKDKEKSRFLVEKQTLYQEKINKLQVGYSFVFFSLGYFSYFPLSY